MSALSSQARSRVPRIAEAAVERARLTVVPRITRSRAPRVPFVTLVSLLLGATTTQLVGHRRVLRQRQHQAQALWLARAGAERAVARLLADPSGYNGESLELIPHGEVKVSVKRVTEPADAFEVTSSARYPTDEPHPVVREVRRRFRRVVEGDRARLTAGAAGGAKEGNPP